MALIYGIAILAIATFCANLLIFAPLHLAHSLHVPLWLGLILGLGLFSWLLSDG